MPKENWRDKYRIHPAADVLPMMSDDELAELGKDIKANGLTTPILLWADAKDEWLIDGRNRLEAMQRAGILDKAHVETFTCKEPASHIISLNIHRRHLTKEQKADLIVAICLAAEEAKPKEAQDNSRQNGEKSKPGRKANPAKAQAVAEGKEHGIAKRTTERSFSKAASKKLTREQKKAKEEAAAKRREAAKAKREAKVREMLAQAELERETRDKETNAQIKELMELLTPKLSRQEINRVFQLLYEIEVLERCYHGFTYKDHVYAGDPDVPDTIPEDAKDAA